MALTLDDITNAPSDPLELNKHLMDRGLIPLPPPPTPPVNVAPMTPIVPHTNVAPMVPPVLPNATAGAHIPEPIPLAKATVTPMSPLGANMAIGATAQPTVKPMSPVNVGAAPDLGSETAQPMERAPGAEPGGIAPMIPPKAPTAQESIAAGMAQHGDTAKEEGKRQFNEMRPVVDAPPNSSEFWKEKIAQDEFDKAHPWGSDISAHPGLLGKIGHVAGLIGQTAGAIVAPGAVAQIPGTRINRSLKEQAEEAHEAAAEGRENAAKNTEAENTLRGAQTKNLESEIEARENPATPKQTPEEETLHDLMTGENGAARINPETQKPYSYLEAYEATKQAGQKPTATPEGEKPLGVTGAQLNAGLKTRYQVLNPGKELPAEFTLGPNATQKDYDRIDKLMENTEKATGTKAQQDAANELRKQAAQDRKDAKGEKEDKEGEEPVIGFDKDGIQRIMPRSQAEKEGLTHVVKSSAKDRADAEQNTSALNDMTAKVKNIVQSSQAIDKLGAVQKTLIQVALSGHPDDYKTRFAVSQMEPEAKQYVQDVFSLREASLGLPKQITGGSRVSEPQATALFNTIPGSSGDHAYRLSQLKKFDENLGRLSKKVPRVEGNDLERAFPETGKGGGGGGTVKIGGKEIDLGPDGTFENNGHTYKITPGSKQATLVK